MTESLYKNYCIALRDPHDKHDINNMMTLNYHDFRLRNAIGKTDDIKIPLASHKGILLREFGKKRYSKYLSTLELDCRVCNRDLSGIVGRFNDYLVLRHPLCMQPICLDCAKNTPDEFHLAFQRGVIKLQEDKEYLKLLQRKEKDKK